MYGFEVRRIIKNITPTFSLFHINVSFKHTYTVQITEIFFAKLTWTVTIILKQRKKIFLKFLNSIYNMFILILCPQYELMSCQMTNASVNNTTKYNIKTFYMILGL